MSDLFLGAPQQHQGEPAPSRRSRQHGKARKVKERRRRRKRGIVVMIMALALVAGAGYVVVTVLRDTFSGSTTTTVSDFPGPGQGEAMVVVSPGDTGAAIGAKLEESGIVATSRAFTQAFSENPDSGSIQPGQYKLLQQMPAADAVSWLLDPANRVSYRLTVQEGLNHREIYTKVSTLVAGVTVDDLTAAAADPAVGLPPEAGGNIEGWLFPATYQVEPGASAVAVLQPMVARTIEVLTAKGIPRDQWQTVLNKAALVEREGRTPEDRAKIAQAIENRLAREMILQIDASVAYGLNKPGTELTRDDTKDPSNPYNTYQHVGLPPGPIASPSEIAIDSVLHPTPGPWLYWCTVNLDTGETKFADNLADHEKNRAELNAWQAANGK